LSLKEWKNITMKPLDTTGKPVDLDLHWDKRAQEIEQAEIKKYDPSCKRRLEDYFDFLAEFEGSHKETKPAPVLFHKKFEL